MTVRQRSERVRRANIVVSALEKLFPDARIALKYSNPWELMVAVQLSAQCTDVRVNSVTARLFDKYHTLDDYVSAKPCVFERDIYSTGYFRNKTRNILAAAKMLRERFGGTMPRTMAEILLLPGVARKTANVVLGSAYSVVDGIAVDTHVKRISRKLELTKETDPVKIERDLMEILPKTCWLDFSYRIIEYGRTYCPARKHDHAQCPLTRLVAPDSSI